MTSQGHTERGQGQRGRAGLAAPEARRFVEAQAAARLPAEAAGDALGPRWAARGRELPAADLGVAGWRLNAKANRVQAAEASGRRIRTRGSEATPLTSTAMSFQTEGETDR